VTQVGGCLRARSAQLQTFESAVFAIVSQTTLVARSAAIPSAPLFHVPTTEDKIIWRDLQKLPN
jgi:hypothetical protein